MYIAIYKNGNQIEPLTRQTWEQICNIKEDVYVFKYGKGTIGWANYIDNNEKISEFKHGEYTLKKINYNHDGNYNNYYFEFIFRYGVRGTDIKVFGCTTKNQQGLPNALIAAIKKIILASKFDSWETYTEHIKCKSDNEKLRKEISALKNK